MLTHPGARLLHAIRTYLPAIAALAACSVAVAQTALVSTVQTVTTPTSPPAAVHQFTATTAGAYTVKLTDYGSSIPGGAPLASLGMIVTQGTGVVGTPASLSQAGSITFTATANTTYTLHVVGEPAATPGYGVTEEDVTGPGFSQNFADTFTLPSQKASGFGVVNQTFTAAGTGSVSYSVTLTDLAFPSALQSAELLLIDNTTGTAVTTLATSSTQLTATSTGNLNGGDSYQLIAFGAATSSQPDGLFGVSLLVGGTAVSGFPDIVPIGNVTFLKSSSSTSKPNGSFTFASTTAATLAVTDLRFPDNTALSALGAVVVDATAVQAVASSIAGGASQTSISAPSTTDSYQVFAYATSGSTAPNGGSYAVTVAQPSGSVTSYPFSEAQAVTSTATTAEAFNIDQSIPGPGPYVFTLTDFGFPAKLTVAALAAVQNGAMLGQLAETGSFNVTAAQGPLTLLVFGGSSSSDGSLLGIDLSPPNGGTPLFDITQGIGAGFSSTPLSVTTAEMVQVNVADLKFPGALGNLSVALTNGTKLVSYIASAGSSGNIPPTQLSANTTYYVNVIAQPNTSGSQKEMAGTYAMSAYPSPVVTLSASSTSITSGNPVTLTWTAQNATSCTASGGSGWQGNESSAGGSAATSALTSTTTFSLSCSGAGGTASASATVSVTPDPPSGGHGGGGAFDPGLLLALAALLALRVRAMLTVRAAAFSSLILSVIILGGCTGAEARRESYIERGQAYLANGDYARASVEFRNAMQVSPEDPHARILAGKAAEKMGRYRDAAALYQSVVESSPDNVEARVDLGEIFEFGGVPERALKLIAPALAKHPNDAGLLTVRALARSELKDFAGALSDAERAVQLAPTSEQAVGLLAGLYRQRNESAKAAALVEATLQKLPQSTDLRQLLASVYTDAGDDARAAAQLEKLIALKPAESQYRQQLAQLYVRERSIDQAEAVLRDAVKALPDSDEAKLALVDLLATHRSAAQGEAALQAFVAASPNDSELRLALGSLYERNGVARQALDAYGEVVRRDGDGPGALAARNHMAAIDMAQGHNDVAAAEVASVLSKDAGNDAALMIRGNLELEEGHPTAAVTDFRAVLRDEPGLVSVHEVLARALLANGSAALAEEELKTAIQIAPDDAATRLELAQIYLQAHATDRAVTLLEQSVQQLPTSGPLRGALVRAYIAKGDLQSASMQADSMAAALPHSGAGPYLQGLIALSQKKIPQAEADFEEALKRQPKAVTPLVDLTRLELDRHEQAKAAQRLQSLVRSDPKNGLALELLGELDLSQKAYPEAIDAFSRAVQAAPELWTAYRNLAVAKAQAGDAAGAIAAYQSGIKAAPDQPQLVAELASYYVRQGQPDQAIGLYEALYQRNPRSTAAASNLALLLATYRTDRQSLDRARNLSAQFASSSDGDLLDTNGWALLKSGDLQHALPLLRRAAARDPQSGLIRYHVAMAELQGGDRGKAQADLKAALAASPSFPGAADARTKLAGLQSGAG